MRCSSFRACWELRVESKRAQDLIDDTLWHNFIGYVSVLPTAVLQGTSLCLEIVVHGVEVYFSTCYLGMLRLEGAINCILARMSHQRTTSKKRTKALLPNCPLFWGSTVYINLKKWVAWYFKPPPGFFRLVTSSMMSVSSYQYMSWSSFRVVSRGFIVRGETTRNRLSQFNSVGRRERVQFTTVKGAAEDSYQSTPAQTASECL